MSMTYTLQIQTSETDGHVLRHDNVPKIQTLLMPEIYSAFLSVVFAYIYIKSGTFPFTRKM